MLIPQDNEKDLVEIPDNVKDGLDIVAVSHVDEVIKYALVEEPEPIEWDPNYDDEQKSSPITENDGTSGAVAH